MGELPNGLMREGFTLLASTAGPFIGGLLLVGLVVGILQATTQINDPAVVAEVTAAFQRYEIALNSNVSATTVFAPFELNHGYMPRIDLPVNTDTTFKGVLQFAQQA